jgi:glycogen synthase
MKTSPSHSSTTKLQRVLITTDTVGGIWSFSMELAQGLSRLGVKVALAALGGRPSRAARADVRRLQGVELHESTYRLEWMRDPWRDVEAAGRWLLQLESQFQPQLVHLNSYCHASLPFGAPALVVGHSCQLSWWDAVKREPRPPEWQQYKERVASGLSAADMVVAPSAAMLSALEKQYGKMKNGRVIPNGRGIGIVGPAPQKEPFVITAGRLWDEAKNVMALDAVAPKLSWPVYAAGDCSCSEGGTIAPKSLQLLGRLHPRTIAQWFSRAAIYAGPARYEPFGLSALEAALSGCALVLGDLPSQREIWLDAALYVPPDDHAALEHALNRLITNERFRRDMATRAHTRAQTFTGCRMLAGYTQAYRDLLQGLQKATALASATLAPNAIAGATSS